MTGRTGLFRKSTWEKSERIPIGEIRAILIEEGRDGPSLGFRTRAWGDDYQFGYLECRDEEAVESLVVEILQRNPQILVNSTDLLNEAREAQASANEIVGTERVATIPRYLILGPLGALAFKKRKSIRRKDLS